MQAGIRKVIRGYPNYIICEDGRVFNLDRPYKVVKQHRNQRGYLRVSLSRNGKSKAFLVHRLVAAMFIGDVVDKEVHHKDRRISNNHRLNLEILSIEQHQEIHHTQPLTECPF